MKKPAYPQHSDSRRCRVHLLQGAAALCGKCARAQSVAFATSIVIARFPIATCTSGNSNAPGTAGDGILGAGSAHVSVSIPLTVDEISSVTGQISAADIPTPIVLSLVVRDQQASALVGGVPAGVDRIFALTAYRGVEAVCAGSATSDVLADQRVSVAVLLQCGADFVPVGEAEIGGSFNFPPEIHSVAAAPSTVSAGEDLALTVTAAEPDGETLSYFWSSDAGLFSDPTVPTTTWTAPAVGGICRITIEVQDPRGGVSSTHIDITVTGGAVLPTRIAPGATVVVDAAGTHTSDFYRSPSGSLFVAGDGPAMGRIWVSRSDDEGASWTLTDLGIAYGNHTYNARVFGIDAGTVGVTGAQGTSPPYDAHMRYSTDDGLNYNASWINVSQSGDLWGPKNFTTVARAPNGSYIAGFRRDVRLLRRHGTDLDEWSSATRDEVYTGAESLGAPSFTSDGTNLFAVVPTEEASFVTLVSTDNGASFWRASTTSCPETFAFAKPYYDTDTEALYLCGTTKHIDHLDEHVYTYRSTDGGVSWLDETLHIRGLDRAGNLYVSCHVDASGVYVAYEEQATGEVRIILPGNPSECGNGIREPGEVCDGADLAGEDCVSMGFGGGTLACASDCLSMLTDDCSAAAWPTSCDFVASTTDGEYTIDPDGSGANPPFSVYCADLASGTPATYLSLSVVGGGSNTSLWYRYTVSDWAECTYSRVRLVAVEPPLVDGTDQRFASCTGVESQYSGARWGIAASCIGCGRTDGTMNIDLTGTPFVLDVAGGVSYSAQGWCQAGAVTRDEGPGRIVEAVGGGYCGSMAPNSPPGLLLTFAP